MKKAKIKLGDIFQIPLPNGKFAYGRVYRDACIAIYQEMTDLPNQVPKEEKFQFIVGFYQDILKTGQWQLVGNRPFQNKDEEWPPPMFVIDKISGGFSIYHKGEFSKSKKEECLGLEEAAVWDAEHIIDRIRGIDIWHKR